MNMKRIIYLLIGPILLVVSSLGLTGVFGTAVRRQSVFPCG